MFFSLARRTYSTRGPNHEIIKLLTKNLQDEEQSVARNGYKVRAFAMALETIQQLEGPLRTAEEAKKLKGVGPGITRRIQAFLNGENYDDLPHGKTNASDLYATLQLVPGIGAGKAQKLVGAGCQSILDLKKPHFQEMLTHPQKLGHKYFSHLREDVTRAESECVLEFIRSNISSKFDVQLAGSYRRGAQSSGDIDVILTHPSHVHVPTPPPPGKPLSSRGRKSIAFHTPLGAYEQRHSNALADDVVRPLEDRGLIADTLASGAHKWRGIVRLPEPIEGASENGNGQKWGSRVDRLERIRAGQGTYRRLDLNLVPVLSQGAALLALTGDVEFNKDIRMRATRLGLHLNEFGLWRWRWHPDGSDEEFEGKNSEQGYWQLIRADSEEKILKEIDMDYVEPEKRNFGFLLKKRKS